MMVVRGSLQDSSDDGDSMFLCLLSRIIAMMERYCCAYALHINVWEDSMEGFHNPIVLCCLLQG
jgi:hypothetical protein